MPDVLPASETKHLTTLYHPYPSSSTLVELRQRSIETAPSTRPSSTKKDEQSGGGGTGTTGTTLWLGAQVLACYLYSVLPSRLSRNALVSGHPEMRSNGRQKVLELGSGTGYLALVLAGMGYDVIATDIEPVVSSILRPNVEANVQLLLTDIGSGIGNFQVEELDWTAPKDAGLDVWAENVDMVVMSDTIYHPDLNPHLFDTVRFISRLKYDQSGSNRKIPPVYLALERRDPGLIDSALALAGTMGFSFKRVGHERCVRAVKSAGWGLEEDAWDGVEVWKGRWSP